MSSAGGTSVGAELPRQIERVSAKRERYRVYAKSLLGEGFPEMAWSLTPVIAVMTHDLDAASAAVASGDVIACILAYQALRDFGDDD